MSVRCVRSTKTDERIAVLFGMETLQGPRNIVLDGGFDPPTKMGRTVFDATTAILLWPLVEAAVIATDSR